MADAEVVACAIACLDDLGFKDFYVRINSRKILNSMLEKAGIDKSKFIDVLRSIDKLEKIGIDEVKKELSVKEVSKEALGKIIKFITLKTDNEKILAEMAGFEGIEDIKKAYFYLKSNGLESKVKIDPSLTRGLDYYTGLVFEIFADNGVGSVAGGGRYDKMISLFLGNEVPATGISLGIERIAEIMKERKMLKSLKTNTKAFVVAVNDKVRKDVLDIVGKLRKNGIPTDYDLRSRKLSKQLEYAGSMKIPFAVIIGPKELEKKSVNLRNMETGKEEMVKIKDLSKKF
jgi:histidyl-tRNA synthetase